MSYNSHLWLKNVIRWNEPSEVRLVMRGDSELQKRHTSYGGLISVIVFVFAVTEFTHPKTYPFFPKMVFRHKIGYRVFVLSPPIKDKKTIDGSEREPKGGTLRDRDYGTSELNQRMIKRIESDVSKW